MDGVWNINTFLYKIKYNFFFQSRKNNHHYTLLLWVQLFLGSIYNAHIVPLNVHNIFVVIVISKKLEK